MQHIVTVEGRCLIRTFLAGATKDAEVCLVSKEQAQNKKLRLDLVLPQFPRLPLYKEKLRILAKLRKVERKAKYI